MTKKLTKGTDKKLCGVCSGLADYFGVDVTIWRLAFILMSLFVGGGLLLYIVGALIMPNPENVENPGE